MSPTVYLPRRAARQLSRLPPKIQDVADLAISDLEEQGVNLHGWDTLKTDDDAYRFAVELSLSAALPGNERTSAGDRGVLPRAPQGCVPQMSI